MLNCGFDERTSKTAADCARAAKVNAIHAKVAAQRIPSTLRYKRRQSYLLDVAVSNVAAPPRPHAGGLRARKFDGCDVYWPTANTAKAAESRYSSVWALPFCRFSVECTREMHTGAKPPLFRCPPSLAVRFADSNDGARNAENNKSWSCWSVPCAASAVFSNGRFWVAVGLGCMARLRSCEQFKHGDGWAIT
jgi:hypothetical protein